VPEGKEGVVPQVLVVAQEDVGEVEAIVALVSHLPAAHINLVFVSNGK
jgi:hypothetical protein